MLKAMTREMLFSLIRPLPDRAAIQILLVRKFKRLCDFQNPITFNEKINWRKLYQRDPRLSVFADKIAVKREIARLVGEQYVVPTLWHGERPEDIPFESLKPPYVIKTNHGWNDAVFIRSKDGIDKKKIAAKMKKALRRDHGRANRERAYRGIKPEILVEKMLQTPDGGTPNDYKFFVYHGKAHFVQVDSNRFGEHKMAFFGRDWNKLPFTKGNLQIEGDVPKPLHYDLMIELAEKIGAQFDFVRVDFYDLPEGVFFGETTFYPAAGFGRFYPDEWDEIFGRPWKISSIFS